MATPEWQGFISDEHFSVDGSLIDAWASHKKPACSRSEFTEAKLRFMTHTLSENRNGLGVDEETTQASSTAEWGADKGYDTVDFVSHLQSLGIKAHVARKMSGWPAG